MLFLLVARNLRLSFELLWVLIPLFEALSEGFPIFIDLDQNGVGNLPGESLITFQLLQTMEDLRVGERLAFMNINLPNLINNLIIKVFRSKNNDINDSIT